MKSNVPIAVCSRSFSRHPVLRAELSHHFSNIRFNDSGVTLTGGTLIDFLQDRVAAIIGMETIDAALIEQLPQLRILSKYGVGLDRIDQELLKAHDVKLCTSPGVNRSAVAELTLAFIISLLRHVPQSQQELSAGTFRQIQGRELSSSVVGVLGCGNIGQLVAVLCRAFGATVLAHDVKSYDAFYQTHDVHPCSLDELLHRSDVLTIHTPLDASTRNIISAARIARMKAGSILINTARGGLVNEDAVVDALANGRLSGAAFDVFQIEPPGEHRLFHMPNVITTGHIGGHTKAAILAMGRAAIHGLLQS